MQAASPTPARAVTAKVEGGWGHSKFTADFADRADGEKSVLNERNRAKKTRFRGTVVRKARMSKQTLSFSELSGLLFKFRPRVSCAFSRPTKVMAAKRRRRRKAGKPPSVVM